MSEHYIRAQSRGARGVGNRTYGRRWGRGAGAVPRRINAERINLGKPWFGNSDELPSFTQYLTYNGSMPDANTFATYRTCAAEFSPLH
jgi:hypothetical protein